jgi:hypothetical protein
MRPRFLQHDGAAMIAVSASSGVVDVAPASALIATCAHYAKSINRPTHL